MNRARPALALLVLGACAAPLLAGCAAPRCQNAVAQRVAAPGGEHDAVVYHRSCGRNEGASTEVAVLPHGADLPDVPTSVLTLADSTSVAARWTTPAELAVSYPASARVVVKVDRSSEGVAVVYSPTTPAGTAP